MQFQRAENVSRRNRGRTRHVGSGQWASKAGRDRSRCIAYIRHSDEHLHRIPG